MKADGGAPTPCSFSKVPQLTSYFHVAFTTGLSVCTTIPLQCHGAKNTEEAGPGDMYCEADRPLQRACLYCLSTAPEGMTWVAMDVPSSAKERSRLLARVERPEMFTDFGDAPGTGVGRHGSTAEHWRSCLSGPRADIEIQMC